MSSIITPKIQSIGNLFIRNLTIPDYQRPYRWEERHVAQLIEDLKSYCYDSAPDFEYRLGTVILHQSNLAVEIVDGQQRIITLCILLAALSTEIREENQPSLLSSLEITHPESLRQIRHNSAFIKLQIELLNEVKLRQLYDFILHRCTLVVIELGNLSEAFQFFDSQNSRGKALEPHDLLKAYHLREMTGEPHKYKLEAISHWEKEAASSGDLKPIFDNYLFRLRRWVRGQSGRHFTNKYIDVFKGVKPTAINIPDYLEVALRAHVFTQQYNDSAERIVDKNKLQYPHQLDQVILNGSRFFEFVAHYIEKKKHLLTHPALVDYLDSYLGSYRVGDIYTRNLFLAVVMLYHDRFKEQYLTQAVHVCFCWAYKLRLENTRVSMASVDNYAKSSDSLISTIKNAVYAKEVLRFVVKKNKEAVITNKTTNELDKLNSLYLGKDYRGEQ